MDFELIRDETIDLLIGFIRNSNDPNIYNTKGNEGKSPLHYACERGAWKCVRLFLVGIDGDIPRRPIDVNAKDHYCLTPLFVACEHWKKECIEILHKDERTNTIGYQGATILHYSCAHGNADFVKMALGICNIDSQNDSGDTPLHLACLMKRIYHAKFLIENGANVNIKNKGGLTPFDVRGGDFRRYLKKVHYDYVNSAFDVKTPEDF